MVRPSPKKPRLLSVICASTTEPPSTAPIPGKIDSMAFAVATCPKCSESFRLIWRIGGKKLPVSTVIRLTCPACAHSFEQVAVELTVFNAGREQFPKSVVVDKSALNG